MFIKTNNSNETNDNEIIPENSKTFFIEYQTSVFHLSDISPNSVLQINIHSINCNINIDIKPVGEMINSIDLNFYSFRVNSNNTNISITPIMDIVEGHHKENYAAKKCPLTINSYYIPNNKTQQLNISDNEETVLYLTPNLYNDLFHISYKIKKVTNNFVSLHFKFKEAQFIINITYCKNKKNSITKNISESSFIYLDSKFLSCDNTNIEDNGNLFINIHNNNSKNIHMYLKIIEDESVSLLEENALNFGFITSKTTYQYFYTEVLQGEEGELMLHNKRQYGILHAIIKNKNDINDIYNTSNYPKEDKPQEELEYDQHYLQLKFNNDNTSNCSNGCYLLITYEQIKSKGDFHLVGYEFTILSRNWNYTDYMSTIIDIPYNEYIISCFGKNASREHYYSIYIPDDFEEIIIQLEGDYFKAFYGEGRQKINTLNERTKVFDKKELRYVKTLDMKDLNSKEKILSFAFRPEHYYTSIIASYYFRVLYTKKKDEIKYLPMDSNFDNLCLPQNDTSSEYYYCNFILKNNYNEANLNFSVSSTNQNEYVKINFTGKYKDNITYEYIDYFNYVYKPNNSNIDYFLIQFQFKNNEMKTIISSFSDKIEETYPQIYSAQMFYLDNFTRFHHFQLKNSFLSYYQYINGSSGIDGDRYSSLSFKGKLVSMHINNGDDMNVTVKTNKFIYYIELKHNLQSQEIEELKQGKPLVKFTNKTFFPLYFSYKIQNTIYININVNLKINEDIKTENYDYIINGYIINEDTINRKTNGEYVEIPAPTKGNYSNAYGIGLLQINETNNSIDTQYLLIEIKKIGNHTEELNLNSSFFFVEIMVKEHDNNGFFLPQNEYILDTFDDAEKGIREVNKYSIFNPQGDEIQPVVELSSQYNDTTIHFEGVETYKIETDNLTGFWRYTIYERINETIYFNVSNSGKNTNFMMIYYLNEINDDYSFTLDKNFEMKDDDNNQNITNIYFTFNGITVEKFYEKKIDFFIIGTLYEKNDDSFELINALVF